MKMEHVLNVQDIKEHNQLMMGEQNVDLTNVMTDKKYLKTVDVLVVKIMRELKRIIRNVDLMNVQDSKLLTRREHVKTVPSIKRQTKMANHVMS